MDYKSVIEEQIRELQKVQDDIMKRVVGNEDEACKVAETIAELCEKANNI